MRRLFSPVEDGRRLAAIIIVAGVYFISAKLGLKLASLHPSATPVWPGTGIALASLLLLGPGVWPGIFLGAFLANLTTAGTVWTSLGIATGNTLEGVAGAYLIRTYANGAQVFARWQDIFAFAALAAVAATTVSATIGVTTLALAGFAPWGEYQRIWLTWWLGDAAGALIFTPLLVLWAQAPRVRWSGRDIVERAFFLAALLAISWIVFGGIFAFPYLTVPFLIWAAFRFDPRETAAVIVLLSVIAAWGTVRRLGPFVGTSPNESLLRLQTFMGLMVLAALPLASVVKDNERRIVSEQRARRDAERAAGRAARVQAVTAALSGAVTQAQVVDVILDQGIHALGARAGWVSVLSEDGDALQLVGHAGGYSEEFVTRLRRTPLAARRPATEAARTGRPLFFESEASVRAGFPDVHVYYGDVARAAIPLSAAGRPLGVLVLNFPTQRAFGDDDRSLMLTLAQQCAQALERARLYEREHYVAKTLQQAFLPATLPAVPGMTIDAVYASAGAPNSEIGGDWYDVFRLPDGRIAVSVGDVVGSGVQAAVMMAQVRQSIRAIALEGQTPTAVLDRAGKVLQLAYEREGMATAVFGILDPVSRTFTYANAGHPPPALGAPGREIQALPSGGGPLGLGEVKLSGDRTVLLPPGGLLALYTDGLIESTRDPAHGEQLLIEAVRAEVAAPSPRPAQTLLSQVVGSRAPSDDVAIVTISIDPGAVEALALTLPAEPASLRLVRQAVQQLIQSLHLDGEQAFRIQVALGEAVNNAVEHAYGAGEGEFRLRVWRDGDALRAEVSDDGQWRPERQEGQGHGLGIMRALAQTIDVAREPAGTMVRLAWPLAPASGPGTTAAAAPDGDAGWGSGAESGPDSARTGAGRAGGYPPFSAGQFTIGELDGVPVVHVSGDVDLNNAWVLAEHLEAAARSDKRAVVVSLSDASFFDSTAIHVLLRFERRLTTNRQRLLLAVGRDRPARRIIDLTGLSHTIPVFDSVTDAVAGTRQDR